MAGNAYKNQYSPEEAIKILYQNGLMDGKTGFLQNLIDNSLEIGANSFFWQEHFMLEGNEIPVDLSDRTKNPAWTVRSKINRLVPMADSMAPMAEVAQLDNEGWEERTGSLYQYGKGLYQTSLGKKELEAKLLEMNMTDQNILAGFVRGVSDLVKAHNFRLSHMAAMVLSKGGAYDNISTAGFSGVSTPQNAYIPASNFKTAGAKVWTDSSCDLISQMQKIEYDYKVANNIDEGALFEWDIPYTMVLTVLLKNSFFIAEVNRWIQLYSPDKVIVINNSSSSVNTNVITTAQLEAYSRSDISKISPIRVIKENQTVQGFTATTNVKGWKEGVAVLRPIGMAGVVVHGQTADVQMLQSGEVNSGVNVSIAKVQGFLYLINKEVPNGTFKAYHTDVIGRYAPVLNEIQYHVVVDTTTAD